GVVTPVLPTSIPRTGSPSADADGATIAASETATMAARRMPHIRREGWKRSLAGANQPLDRRSHLRSLLLPALADAMLHVVLEHLERDAVERRACRRDLREDVDAVALVLDHLLQPAYLALRALEAADEQLLLIGADVAV